MCIFIMYIYMYKLYVYVCIYMYIYMYQCMCMYTLKHVYIYTCIHIYVGKHTHIYVHTYAYTCINLYIHMHRSYHLYEWKVTECAHAARLGLNSPPLAYRPKMEESQYGRPQTCRLLRIWCRLVFRVLGHSHSIFSDVAGFKCFTNNRLPCWQRLSLNYNSRAVYKSVLLALIMGLVLFFSSSESTYPHFTTATHMI